MISCGYSDSTKSFRRPRETAATEPDILFLKHGSSIFRQSSNPVCGSWTGLGIKAWGLVFFASKVCFLGRLWTDLVKKIGAYELSSNSKYSKFLQIWSTETWETQLLKEKVTNPHASIPSPVHGRRSKPLLHGPNSTPHTGLDDCLNMLLTCFRKSMSEQSQAPRFIHAISARDGGYYFPLSCPAAGKPEAEWSASDE